MGKLTHTYTVVEMELSASAYEEIAAKMRAARYDHAFMTSPHDGPDYKPPVDMTGIAVTFKPMPIDDSEISPLTHALTAKHNAAKFGNPERRYMDALELSRMLEQRKISILEILDLQGSHRYRTVTGRQIADDGSLTLVIEM